MICETGVVVQVSLQRLSTLRLRIACFNSGFLVVPIAIVPRRSVTCPVGETNPAKLVATFFARHVVATAILLNR